MPRPIRLYVRWVDTLNRWVGKSAMYLFFAMAAVMLWSTISRALFGVPVNWALETTQFLLSAYYLLGGAYSLQQGAHVRMDLFYDRLPARRRAMVDAQDDQQRQQTRHRLLADAVGRGDRVGAQGRTGVGCRIRAVASSSPGTCDPRLIPFGPSTATRLQSRHGLRRSHSPMVKVHAHGD